MTAGNNGTGTPESEDPFAHLYRSEGGGSNESAPAAPQPGVPRTSYNQVRTVGSRQYGPRQPQPPHASQPAPHYAAPETLPGGVPRQPAAPGHGGHGGGSRPKRTGLLVAAIAVVAVVAGGITAAMLTNSGTSDDQGSNQAATGGEQKEPQGGEDKKPSKEPEKKKEPSNPSAVGNLKRDASSLKLVGSASTAKDTPGAKAANGAYVVVNQEGAGIEWEVSVPSGGDYRLYANYGVPGTDNALSVTTNGSKSDRPIGMKNYGNAKPGEWVNFWVNTWSLVTLKEGKNTIKLSCEPGNKCDVHIDQVWLTAGGA
ncbi:MULTISPECIES: carbohydrate-binding protein [Streptomyces]|uniref:Carbohydrate-binding protein n=1 Tax=Streptomyces nondiastaticus TaxID=3154512 RepID=A0ABW6U7G9_9ACTN|nr:carbohydrate-binding protein [Streptomyces sp. VNUA116]WKU46374.1 carbohydrate-binding protein [Streptomyces sp. VNUA116]